MLNKFAQELKESREKADITLQNLSARSRLDIKFLQSMEKGDFSFLPELYVKAFIKDYAKFIGLDANETIKKYEAAKKGIDYNESKDETETEVEQADKKEKPDAKEKLFGEQQNKTVQNTPSSGGFNSFFEKQNPKTLAIIGGIILVVIIALLVFNSNNQPEIIVKEKPYEQVRKENQQRFVQEKNKSNTVIKKGKKLALLISATDTSWIKIQSDTSGPKEFTLFPGSKININSYEKFVMIIGNSGGVSLKLNGNELNISGKDKLVKYLVITKKGISFLKIEPTFTS
ncbi:MAG TPA: helix-turn-helix domain-containing protein, partial [Ignavibacteria bacterium]|nr:helix-turn-helix domain-containing protein [Ignavibacteria bacterium]